MKEVYLFLSLRCVGGGCKSEGILSLGHPDCRRPISSNMEQAMDSQQIQNESQESPRSTIIQRTAHDHNFTFENKENMTRLSENEPKTKESNVEPTKGPDHRTTTKSWSADSCRGLSTHSYSFYFISNLLNFVPRFIQSFGLSSTTNALSRLLQLISGARGFTALFYRLDSWSCHFGRKVATNNLCSNVSIVIIIIFQVFPMCTANCFSSSFFLTCAKALLLEVEVVKDVATTLG